MTKIAKQTIQSRFALILLSVFIGSLLIKPLHILLSHHQHAEESISIEHDEKITANHYNYCPICDFEFCTFIPQKQISITQVTLIVRKEQTLPTVACLAAISTHLFQLRAPPSL